MSLLLDALKKAARDKQNADTSASADPGALPNEDAARESDGPVRERESPRFENKDEFVHNEPLEELELPEDPDDGEGRSRNGSTVTATPSTVTDDALQLLIHRTNKEYGRSRSALWGSVVAGVIVAVLLGGLYFYMDMNSEIESIERKHRIELAALQSKTRIEENLTSLAEEVRKENQPTKAAGSRKVETITADTKQIGTVNSQSKADSAASYHIERNRKEHPVSTLLNRGWRAFQHRDYHTAADAYSDVLKREPNNQDALLGVAAVAVKQQDYELAKSQYIRLLELDPRDPQAHAGLANLAQMDGASLSENRLKQLIEYNPQDASLQFTLGNLHAKEGDWPSAQSAYFRAWQNDTLNPDYAFNLAVSLDQLGKQQEAARFYRDSMRLADGKNISFSTAAVRQRLQQIQGNRP